jgi:hypothetical protein
MISFKNGRCSLVLALCFGHAILMDYKYKYQCSVETRAIFFAELASRLAMTLAAVARTAFLLSVWGRS